MTPPPAAPETVTGAQLAQAALLAFAITGISDFLLWPAPPGLSFGVLVLALGAIQVAIHGRQPWRPSTWIAVGVLLVSSVQSAVELSVSNVLVTGISLLWLIERSALR